MSFGYMSIGYPNWLLDPLLQPDAEALQPQNKRAESLAYDFFRIVSGGLLAQEFLFELGAISVDLASQKLGFDYLAVFRDDRSSKIIAVEVKATEDDITGRYRLNRSSYYRLRETNIPVLLVVVNVKQNRLFFEWISQLNSLFRQYGRQGYTERPTKR